MNKVGQFEKVSYEKYAEAILSCECYARGNAGDVKTWYENLELPKRATSGSAGYDVKLPFDVTIPAGKTLKIPTGIRVRIDEGWWLGALPRSSLGFKYRLQLDNTMGVIDSDYYFSDNEGQIYLKMTNDSKENKTLELPAGQAIMQCIFLPYGITYNDDADGVRNGGMGSTNG